MKLLSVVLCIAFSVEAVAATADAQSRTVTLITGDQVRIDGVNRTLSIQPGKGREHIRFSARNERSLDGKAEHLYVIPADAMALIARDKIDRDLFDVTELVESHYDDESRDDVPVIMTYRAGSAPRLAASTLSAVGARLSVQLSSINGAAMQISKGQSQTTLEHANRRRCRAQRLRRAESEQRRSESLAGSAAQTCIR